MDLENGMKVDLEAGLKAILSWWEDAGIDTPKVTETTAQRSLKTAPIAHQMPRHDAHPSRQAHRQSTDPQPGKPHSDKSSASPTDEILQRAMAITRKVKTLDALKVALQGFDAGTLSDGARQCVFARGNPDAKIMVIGEAPDTEEDMQGKPFIGPSGPLLNKMLSAIGLSETDVYMTLAINWRPAKNRTPRAEEIEFCRPFLYKHIELVAPKLILLVGNIALKTLTDIDGIMKQRGNWQDIITPQMTPKENTIKDTIASIPALPIYHPDFLMKQPALKKEAWRDLLAFKMKIDSLNS